MATLIGVTGGIGTGKSTVCEMLVSFGAKLIDADQISRSLLEPGHPAFCAVARHFGLKILDDFGRIDRKALGKIVFEDDRERRVLERITHPYIKAGIRKQYKVYREQEECIVALEAPLLFEKGMEDDVDEIWVVVCPPEEQLERVMQRGFSREEAQSRIDAQIPLSIKTQRADRLIDTGVSVEETRQQVLFLWQKICGCE